MRWDVIWYRVRVWWHNIPERLAWAVAFHMPEKVVYYCGIRLWAHATRGQYGTEDPVSIRMSLVLHRWEIEWGQ